MMPVEKSHTNMRLGKPRNWDESRGECEVLPVTSLEGVLYSYWKATWIDRLRILIGRHVKLSVVGNSHPPVWIDTEK
jgi:hypothetical protein